jgi:hypothetical protein
MAVRPVKGEEVREEFQAVYAPTTNKQPPTKKTML